MRAGAACTTAAGGATAGGGSGGGVAHPASASSAAAAMADNEARQCMGRSTVGWVFFEIALALGVAIAIVWWTFPRKPKAREDDPPQEGKR